MAAYDEMHPQYAYMHNYTFPFAYPRAFCHFSCSPQLLICTPINVATIKKSSIQQSTWGENVSTFPGKTEDREKWVKSEINFKWLPSTCVGGIDVIAQHPTFSEAKN